MTEDIHERLEQQMARAVRDLYGSGYVDLYYRDLASDFVGIAEWYAEAMRAHDRREVKP